MTYEAQIAETVYLHGHQNTLIDAYLARPLGAGPFPGVVVIHHMPGWDGSNKEIARRFAHHGYVAISTNLHFREGKATPEENSASIRASGGMPDDRTMGDVQASIDYLRALPYLNGKVGVIGYCSGGRQAYLAAWEAGDDATAWASFSARVRAGISEADYRTEAPMVRSNSTSPGQSRRAFFDPATVKGDSAQVRVTVEVTTVGGINVDRYRTVTTVSLVRESGTWKIDQELMGLEPWGYSKF